MVDVEVSDTPSLSGSTPRGLVAVLRSAAKTPAQFPQKPCTAQHCSDLQGILPIMKCFEARAAEGPPVTAWQGMGARYPAGRDYPTLSPGK